MVVDEGGGRERCWELFCRLPRDLRSEEAYLGSGLCVILLRLQSPPYVWGLYSHVCHICIIPYPYVRVPDLLVPEMLRLLVPINVGGGSLTQSRLVGASSISPITSSE